MGSQTVKRGTNITQVVPSWTYNPDDITAQTLSGPNAVQPLLSERTQTITGLSITTNTTWGIDGIHPDGDSHCEFNLKFCNSILWGRSSDGNIDTIAEMDALSGNDITCNWRNTYNFAASGTSGYIYFCIPVADGAIVSWLDAGDYDVPYVNLGTISYTNNLGHTEDYQRFRTFNEVFGSVIYTIS